MSLLLKKLNQASQAAEENADNPASSQQESAQTPAPAPAAAVAQQESAAQPATPAQPAPGSAGIKPQSAAPPASGAAPAVAKPATTAAPPKATGVKLAAATTLAAEAVSNKPQAKPKILSPRLRTGEYFDRARGVMSASRIFGAQTSENKLKNPKLLAGAAAALVVVLVVGLFAYPKVSSLFGDIDRTVVTAPQTQIVPEKADAVASAFPSPGVDVQAQVAAINPPQAEYEAAGAISVKGEDVIADYAIVPNEQYTEEEWSLIEREEREAVEEEARKIAAIAASDPIGVEAEEEIAVLIESQRDEIQARDDQIEVNSNSDKARTRAAIKTSEQAVHRTAKLSQAANLYAAGRYEQAGRIYGEVLTNAPSNLQALRGSALVATAMQRYKLAADFHVRILEHFPDDPFAVAELSNLGGINPREVERLLKQLLGKTPTIDGRLYFALGNVYAASARWDRARDAFGDALSREKNPDYAYNLAIALEYLHKPELAAHYYKQALQMAQGSTKAGFDADTVRARLAVIDA